MSTHNITLLLVYLRGLSSRALLLALGLLMLSGNLLAATGLTVAWNAPAAGKTPTGYLLYYGTSSGNYSSSINVGNVTTYPVAGLTAGSKYYFALRSYDATSQSAYSTEISATVSAAVTPTVSFVANPSSSLESQSVTFTPTVTPSTASISSWSWRFGDSVSASNTSTLQKPSHTYSTAGTYSVTLTATDSSGNVANTSSTVMVLAVPAAAFTSSASGLTGSFTDASTGGVTAWSWNFGDSGSASNTSTLPSPSHTYSATGTYTVTLTVTAPGGTATTTRSVSVTASAGGGSVTNPNGLVAAYAFDEISGTTVVDASGLGNTGTLTGATRSPGMSGYGSALLLDGASNWVTVNNSTSLALTTGMTIEAWLSPTAAMSGYDTVVAKEGSGFIGYYLSANNTSNQPEVGFYTAGQYKAETGVTPLKANQSVHLATTYDGKSESLYVNGKLVSSTPQTGSMLATTGALRIGGNSLGSQYFKGYIDDVRIYNVALTQAQIAKDMATPLATSNPPQFVAGDQAIELATDSNPQGVAQAFQTAAQKGGIMTAAQVYLDTGSTATAVVAGIYLDSNNHPGTLVAQGTLTTLKAGAWNSVAVPPAAVASGTKYWIAVLGSKGIIKFRDKLGMGSGLVETSASSTLTSLPSAWKTGAVYTTEGPMSAYAVGY